MIDIEEKNSICALIGTTTPDPQGRSGGLAVVTTFESRRQAEKYWKGIADRTLRENPDEWVTHGFHLVEVPPEKRGMFEQMLNTCKRAKKDTNSVFTDDDEAVYFPIVQKRFRAFRDRWQNHLKKLIENYKL